MKKIAVCGKGGVGKTTFTALLTYCLAEQGREVYAIDADVNPTLGEALGFSPEEIAEIRPIIDMRDLLEERTGAKSGEYGSFFKTNPRVKDIPEKFSRRIKNISFLMMGAVRGADQGCACAENAMLKALVTHLILKEKETVIMDMVAGTEHMGRGTAKGVDAMFLVVEPGTRSIKAAKEILKMSLDLGVQHGYALGNKIRSPEDIQFLKDEMPEFTFAGFLPLDNEVVSAERQGAALYERSPMMREHINKIVQDLGI
ncbi:carbon monoxide dehydrogenase accessory protein CooC [Treponema primitia ZAS-2]|uniref:Carbon monoxide dehydrogenase accessory protein CooC n=1 Tax=Treponema primitia (strain ATCC BAA-887 / DSM 12427 / ZAS-2) TaxID=545694 RepID=F5YIC8_TREPZ|nr:P-loop NTPase [Treponema primitia]AEF85654.1 carbon monoxide dehydrogenase accessory protein CooC [Treponema primitia ZAS-2]